jgi:hypothetical protein
VVRGIFDHGRGPRPARLEAVRAAAAGQPPVRVARLDLQGVRRGVHPGWNLRQVQHPALLGRALLLHPGRGAAVPAVLPATGSRPVPQPGRQRLPGVWRLTGRIGEVRRHTGVKGRGSSPKAPKGTSAVGHTDDYLTSVRSAIAADDTVLAEARARLALVRNIAIDFPGAAHLRFRIAAAAHGEPPRDRRRWRPRAQPRELPRVGTRGRRRGAQRRRLRPLRPARPRDPQDLPEGPLRQLQAWPEDHRWRSGTYKVRLE